MANVGVDVLPCEPGFSGVRAGTQGEIRHMSRSSGVHCGQ